MFVTKLHYLPGHLIDTYQAGSTASSVSDTLIQSVELDASESSVLKAAALEKLSKDIEAIKTLARERLVAKVEASNKESSNEKERMNAIMAFDQDLSTTIKYTNQFKAVATVEVHSSGVPTRITKTKPDTTTGRENIAADTRILAL